MSEADPHVKRVAAGAGGHAAARAAFYGYYVALYAPVAVTISFLPLWIKSRGLNEHQIGLLFAIGALLALLINPVVGLIADTRESRKNVLLVLLAGSSAAALLLLNVSGPLWVFAAYAATRACSTGLIPLSESMALSGAARFGLDFGRLRGVGSLSVVVTTAVLGLALDRYGLDAVALALALFYMAQTTMAACLPDVRVAASRSTKAPLVRVLRVPGFPLFLCAAAASQACHGLFYTYSAIHWKALGLSSSVIGGLWSLGVLAEVVAFMLGGRLLAHLSAPSLLLFACLGGVLRWGLVAESAQIGTLVMAQLLQAATLSFTQLSAAQYIKTTVPPDTLSSGTGTYAAAVGLLTAATVYGGSHLYAAFGGHAFALSAMLCLLGAGAAATLRRRFGSPPLPQP